MTYSYEDNNNRNNNNSNKERDDNCTIITSDVQTLPSNHGSTTINSINKHYTNHKNDEYLNPNINPNLNSNPASTAAYVSGTATAHRSHYPMSINSNNNKWMRCSIIYTVCLTLVTLHQNAIQQRGMSSYSTTTTSTSTTSSKMISLHNSTNTTIGTWRMEEEEEDEYNTNKFDTNETIMNDTDTMLVHEENNTMNHDNNSNKNSNNMNNKELTAIVHIGPQKTGTTTLHHILSQQIHNLLLDHYELPSTNIYGTPIMTTTPLPLPLPSTSSVTSTTPVSNKGQVNHLEIANCFFDYTGASAPIITEIKINNSNEIGTNDNNHATGSSTFTTTNPNTRNLIEYELAASKVEESEQISEQDTASEQEQSEQVTSEQVTSELESATAQEVATEQKEVSEDVASDQATTEIVQQDEEQSETTATATTITTTTTTTTTTITNTTSGKVGPYISDGCNTKLLFEIIKIASRTNNVIITSERFAMNNIDPKLLFNTLSIYHNIRIIAYYRRYYEWISSWYYEYNRRRPVHSRTPIHLWIMDTTYISNMVHYNYVFGIYTRYQKVFHTENYSVQIYNLHETDIVQSFFCSAIPDATNTCTAVMKLTTQQEQEQQDQQEQQRQGNGSNDIHSNNTSSSTTLENNQSNDPQTIRIEEAKENKQDIDEEESFNEKQNQFQHDAQDYPQLNHQQRLQRRRRQTQQVQAGAVNDEIEAGNNRKSDDTEETLDQAEDKDEDGDDEDEDGDTEKEYKNSYDATNAGSTTAVVKMNTAVPLVYSALVQEAIDRGILELRKWCWNKQNDNSTRLKMIILYNLTRMAQSYYEDTLNLTERNFYSSYNNSNNDNDNNDNDNNTNNSFTTTNTTDYEHNPNSSLSNNTSGTTTNNNIINSNSTSENGNYREDSSNRMIICPSEESMEHLLQLSLDIERALFPTFYNSERGEVALRKHFESVKIVKFCTVNVTFVLENNIDGWNDFFTNLVTVYRKKKEIIKTKRPLMKKTKRPQRVPTPKTKRPGIGNKKAKASLQPSPTTK